MTRTVIAFLLLCFVLSLCFFSSQNAIHDIEDTITQLENLKTAISQEDFLLASQLGQEVKEGWEEKHRVLCMYISHDRLEKVDEGICSITPLIPYEESAHILSECNRVIAQIRDLKESEILSIENIL